MNTIISWQMIDPILCKLIGTVTTILIGYLVNFVHKRTKFVQWQHDNGVKGQVIRDVILFAQQTCESLSNSSKFTVAFEEARKKLTSAGIQVTDDELKQSIEAMLRQIKNEAGQQWAASQASGE